MLLTKLDKDLKERDRKQQQIDPLLIETYGTAVSKALPGVKSTNAVALAVFLFIYFFLFMFYPKILIASINFSKLE